MTDSIESLRRQMEAAAEALDFEKAKRLRDMITLMSGGAAAGDLEETNLSGVKRHTPGAMGLGTGQPRVSPPAGWTPPPKPNLNTRGHNRRARPKR